MASIPVQNRAGKWLDNCARGREVWGRVVAGARVGTVERRGTRGTGGPVLVARPVSGRTLIYGVRSWPARGTGEAWAPHSASHR